MTHQKEITVEMVTAREESPVLLERKGDSRSSHVAFLYLLFSSAYLQRKNHRRNLSQVRSAAEVHAALLRLGHHFDLEDVERACGFFLGPGADFGRIPYFHLVPAVRW